MYKRQDPFYAPNSAGSNPGNNFDVIDQGFLPNLHLYSWSGNYQDSIDICAFASGETGEIGLKIESLADRGGIGVYLVDDGIGQNPINAVGGGFISLVAPTGFSFQNFTSINGDWQFHERDNRPSENSKSDYISFKSSRDFEIEHLNSNDQILLFT